MTPCIPRLSSSSLLDLPCTPGSSLSRRSSAAETLCALSLEVASGFLLQKAAPGPLARHDARILLRRASSSLRRRKDPRKYCWTTAGGTYLSISIRGSRERRGSPAVSPSLALTFFPSSLLVSLRTAVVRSPGSVGDSLAILHVHSEPYNVDARSESPLATDFALALVTNFTSIVVVGSSRFLVISSEIHDPPGRSGRNPDVVSRLAPPRGTGSRCKQWSFATVARSPGNTWQRLANTGTHTPPL